MLPVVIFTILSLTLNIMDNMCPTMFIVVFCDLKLHSYPFVRVFASVFLAK